MSAVIIAFLFAVWGEGKMKKSVKVIRIIVFSIILIFFMCAVSDTLAKYGDAIKVRNILYYSLPFLLIAYIVLIVMLVINPKWKVTRVTILDVVSIVMFIVLLAIGQKEVSSMTELGKAFAGNNIYAAFYSSGFGGNRGYDNMEELLEEEIEYAKNTGNHNEMEEIYRIQAGEKIFVYCKVDEEYVVEFDFIEQDDLYYCLGKLYILYDWIGYDGRYPEEATIKTDIVHTMRRDGVKRLEGGPAWGVSADEQIASMMINGEPVDEVILVNEADEKKYYFWLIMNVEELETLIDVKTAEIEMNGLQ